MEQPKQKQINNWIEKRFPVSKFLNWILHKEIPGGAKFSYSLGSSAMFLFMILVITGIWQMFVYVPTVDHAYDSLSYLRVDVPFGWLAHGLHYWSATAFSLVVGLHMIRVFIWGAYKNPREIVWLAGVILLLLTVGLMFTGSILPWDKKGYWACKVGLDMIGAIPLIGSFLQTLVQGSVRLGQLTLSRMYVFHVAILPILMTMIMAIHLIAFRVFGSVGPWNKEKQKKIGQFWPEQIFKDFLVAFFLFFLLVGLAVFYPHPFSGMADPLDTTYIPKPEWNFLFLYQLLKYFPGGTWESIWIVGIPLLIILLFVSLPFIDRSKERNPFKRLFVIFCGLLFIGFILTLTILGFRNDPPSEVGLLEEQTTKNGKQKTNVSPGEKLFYANSCNACHTITGQSGSAVGPDLILALSKRKELTRSWLFTQIVSSNKHDPNTIMPSYDNLTDQEVNALIDFLEKLSGMPSKEENTQYPKKVTLQKKTNESGGHKGVAGFGRSINIVGNRKNGEFLYKEYCFQCHGPQGKYNVFRGVPAFNPINKIFYNNDVMLFLQNIDLVIQHGLPNREKGPDMPAYGDTNFLTQPQIADIEAYILHLNHVDRTKINNSAIAPKSFFFILLGIAGAFFLLGGMYWVIKKRL